MAHPEKYGSHYDSITYVRREYNSPGSLEYAKIWATLRLNYTYVRREYGSPGSLEYGSHSHPGGKRGPQTQSCKMLKPNLQRLEQIVFKLRLKPLR